MASEATTQAREESPIDSPRASQGWAACGLAANATIRKQQQQPYIRKRKWNGRRAGWLHGRHGQSGPTAEGRALREQQPFREQQKEDDEEGGGEAARAGASFAYKVLCCPRKRAAALGRPRFILPAADPVRGLFARHIWSCG